jgi:hypothetical protein
MNISNARVRGIVAFVLAVIIIWLRAPDRVAHGYLWAEDASVFLSEAQTRGTAAITLQYAGYLHLFPRLIAWLQATLSPLRVAPYIYMWASLILTAGACSYIASALRRLPAAASLALGLSLVVSPQNGELLLTIANLQWVFCMLLVVLIWECLFDPPERGLWWRCALTAALAMTGPFGVLLFPFAIVAEIIFCRDRKMSRGQIVWALAYMGGVAAQAMTMSVNPQPRGAVFTIPWLYRVAHDLFGNLFASSASGHVPLIAGAALAVLMIVLVAASRSIAVVGLVLFGLVLWAISVVRIGDPAVLFSWYGDGSRYVYVPLLTFMWAGIIGAVTAPARYVRLAGVTVALIIVLASSTRFQANVWPAWSIKSVPSGYDVTVPPGWDVHIPARSHHL